MAADFSLVPFRMKAKAGTPEDAAAALLPKQPEHPSKNVL